MSLFARRPARARHRGPSIPMRKFRLVVAAHREAQTRRAFQRAGDREGGRSARTAQNAGPEGGTHRQRAAPATKKHARDDDGSPSKFPANREFYREFYDFGPSEANFVARNPCAADVSRAIPYPS